MRHVIAGNFPIDDVEAPLKNDKHFIKLSMIILPLTNQLKDIP